MVLDTLFGRIAYFGKALGITQTALAKKLGVTHSAVNAWEMGLSIPQLKHIIAMTEIFHTTVDGLLYTDGRIVVDITNLSEQEQETILNIRTSFVAFSGMFQVFPVRKAPATLPQAQ